MQKFVKDLLFLIHMFQYLWLNLPAPASQIYTICAPKLRTHPFEMGFTLYIDLYHSTLYAKQNQGLPNITGEFIPWSGKSTYDLGAYFGASTGAIRNVVGTRTKVLSESSSTGTGTIYATFDASYSNAIYGSATENRPDNFAVQYFIKY